MKTTFFVLGGIALIVGLFIGGIFFATSGVVEAGDQFIAKIQAGDYEGAHAQTTEGFREKYSEQKLRTLATTIGLAEISSVSWTGRSINANYGQPSVGELTGTATNSSGDSFPLELQLLKHDEVWEVNGIWNKSSKPDLNPPSSSDALALVSQTTRGLGEATRTGDAEAFHTSTSPEFQKSFSLAKTKELIESSPANGIDFIGLMDVETVFSSDPEIDKQNVLRLVGFFYTDSGRFSFRYNYVFRDAEWKLLGFTVKPGDPNSPPTPSLEPS